MTIKIDHRFGRLFLGLLFVSVLQVATKAQAPGTIEASARVVNLIGGVNPVHPDDAEYHEVFLPMLRDVPVLVRLTVTLGAGAKQALSLEPRAGVPWHEHFVLEVTELDGADAAIAFEMLPASVSAGEPLAEPRRGSRVTELRPGESLGALFRLVGASDGPMPDGRYEVTLRPSDGAVAAFGVECAFASDFRVTLRPPSPAGHDRIREDLIEAHFLTGLVLGEFDPATGQEHLVLARAQVAAYLGEGGGDTPARFNLTPRYQAARIHAALGDGGRAYAAFAEVLKGTVMDARMRHAHFGRTEGRLPRPFSEKIAQHMQRLRPVTR